MKLRNKETGEIRELSVDMDRPDDGIRVYHNDGVSYIRYNSLAELNEEWEDYEEPKAYYIGRCGTIEEFDPTKDVGLTEMLKEIGNYFETKEEAERAVEKLKAWTRLKDAGVRFDECRPEYQRFEIYYVIPERPVKEYDQIFADIYLLFGGEE